MALEFVSDESFSEVTKNNKCALITINYRRKNYYQLLSEKQLQCIYVTNSITTGSSL